jgi:alpha-1,3-rhamnosyl/mannosyltransferase
MTTVCIDCRYIGPRPSGIGEVVQGLVDFLPGLAPDLRFLLLRNPSAKRLSMAENVREIIVRQAANGPATLWWMSRCADLSGVDLFHAPFNIMPGRLSMPCVTTVHDIMWLSNPEWCASGMFAPVKRTFYTRGIDRALRYSAAIMTVSAASRDAIAAWLPDAADRIAVTRSGVSPAFRPVDPDPTLLASLGLPAGKRFVLTVGQFAPYKNHEGALRAFAAAFADRDEIDIVLVQRMSRGTGRLLRLAQSLGISGRVHLLGKIDREELVHLYSAALALLHPSLCEGFGNPLAEAMACGCPVVTSNCSAMPETTGGAAILVDPRNPLEIAGALRRIAEYPGQARQMRERGLARAAELSWRDFARANLDVYRKTLARG